MKLIRLLAPMAMLVAALVAPAPATAADRLPERPLSPGILRSVCTMVGGAYVVDRLATACEIGDGVFVCEDRCEYQVTSLRDQPPLQQQCEFVHGTFLHGIRGQWACELEDGDVVVTCPLQPNPGGPLTPWEGRETAMRCGITIMPSEQPMS